MVLLCKSIIMLEYVPSNAQGGRCVSGGGCGVVGCGGFLWCFFGLMFLHTMSEVSTYYFVIMLTQFQKII